jgi:ubiquinone/menaquinone biosynthesis C-methylase UbiE
MKNIIELIKAIKILGFSHLLRISKAKKLGDEILPGFFITRAMNVLLNVGFFDEVSKRLTIDIDSFAKEKNFDERLLHLLCDYLYVYKILKKDRAKYRLTSKGKIVVEMLTGVFDILYSFEDIFHNLEALVKKEKILGQEVNKFFYFESKGTGTAAKQLIFPIIIDIIKKHNFKKVLDIGCGSGTFLIELCKKNPGIMSYGLDISQEAIIYGQHQLIENNLQGKITLLKGDILNILEIKDSDLKTVEAIIATFVLHELFFENKEKIINFLITLRQKFGNKPLLVCENIKQTLEELRKMPQFYSELQLAHGIACERQLTRREWKEIFNKSGFRNIKERYLAFAKISIFMVS